MSTAPSRRAGRPCCSPRPSGWQLISSGWAFSSERHDEAWEVVTKIHALIQDARRNAFVGIGHPEPLRGKLNGWWSRRITQEHRLVYRVTGKSDEKAIEIAACRFHYGA